MASFVALLVRILLVLSPLAAPLGRFIGAILSECGPVLSEIIAHAIRAAFTDTVEEGAAPPDLVARLRARLLEWKRVHGDEDRDSQPGGPGSTPQPRSG